MGFEDSPADDEESTICEHCDEYCLLSEVAPCPHCGLDNLCPTCQVPEEHECDAYDEPDEEQDPCSD